MGFRDIPFAMRFRLFSSGLDFRVYFLWLFLEALVKMDRAYFSSIYWLDLFSTHLLPMLRVRAIAEVR